MATLTLSNVLPNQSDLLHQFEAYLSGIDSWQGVVTSQTGQGLLNLLAAIGAFNQAKINRKFADSFSETVIADRAANAISVMQGLRLPRKLPAGVTLNLTSVGLAQTLPAYTIFQGAGGFFFNREAIFLAADTPASLTLYEGQVLRYSMPGLDQPYAIFVSIESDFTVSDIDVSVSLNASPMSRATGGMWTLKNQLGFVDSTLPDGKLLIQFGTLTYGGQPSSTDTLYVTYVTTNGADANSLDTSGKGLTCPDYPTVTGVFLTNPTGGADERDALVYKNIPAPTFGNFNSAITKQQYVSTALQYPSIVDVVTFAQREVNPEALEWMNLIKIVPFVSSPWTDAVKADFLTYMHNQSAYSPKFILDDPVAVSADITLDIYCYNWANSTQCKANVIAAMQRLTAPRVGMLNYDLHLSDIINGAQESDNGIEYVTLREPVADILISGSPVPLPTLTLVVSSGSLPVDTYYYGVQATTTAGIIAVRNLAQFKLTVTGKAMQIDWEPITDAISYQIYRKDTTSTRPGLIATVLASDPPTFTDINAVVPGEDPAPQNTVPVRYITLGVLTVTDHYSTRNIRT